MSDDPSDDFSRRWSELPRRERGRILLHASLNQFRHWRAWIGVAIAGTLASVGRVIADWIDRDGSNLRYFLVTAIFSGIGGTLLVCLGNRDRIRYIRAQLPHCCLVCGYDLRASIDRCPECGRSIDRQDIDGKTPNHP